MYEQCVNVQTQALMRHRGTHATSPPYNTNIWAPEPGRSGVVRGRPVPRRSSQHADARPAHCTRDASWHACRRRAGERSPRLRSKEPPQRRGCVHVAITFHETTSLVRFVFPPKDRLSMPTMVPRLLHPG
eukprot:6078649-Prymnesium_polylepis.1